MFRSITRNEWYAVPLYSAVFYTLVGHGEVDAHTGRRFLVEVVDGKLQAQGINSGESDGAPPTRPFVNAVHDHWKNVSPDPLTGLEPFATSFLPDFGIPIDASFVHLRFHELTLELVGSSQWKDPPNMPMPGTIPDLQPLDPGDVIRIESVNGDINTDSLGTLLLSVSVPPAGVDDIVLNYHIEGHPLDTIHVLTFRLAAAPANPSLPDMIDDSDPIYVLLSPDGADPVERLHHASLYLEQYLATPIPEPSTLLIATLAGALLSGLGRKRPRQPPALIRSSIG